MIAPRSCGPLRKSSVPSASEYSSTLGHCTFLRQLHRAFEFWLFRRETKVIGIESIDLRHVAAREGWTIRCCCEFNQLFFVVDVGQSRGDPIIGEQPLQRGLPKCALGIFKETQLVDLFNPVEQPTARAMAAMIGRWERCFRRVFSLEHPRRMRYANQKHCVLRRLSCGIVHGTPRMLLEHVVNVLQARDVALANAIDAFVKPADCWTQRNSIVPN